MGILIMNSVGLVVLVALVGESTAQWARGTGPGRSMLLRQKMFKEFAHQKYQQKPGEAEILPHPIFEPAPAGKWDALRTAVEKKMLSPPFQDQKWVRMLEQGKGGYCERVEKEFDRMLSELKEGEVEESPTPNAAFAPTSRFKAHIADHKARIEEAVKDPSQANFMILRTVSGPGNKVMGLVTGYATALMTKRIPIIINCDIPVCLPEQEFKITARGVVATDKALRKRGMEVNDNRPAAPLPQTDVGYATLDRMIERGQEGLLDRYSKNMGRYAYASCSNAMKVRDRVAFFQSASWTVPLLFASRVPDVHSAVREAWPDRDSIDALTNYIFRTAYTPVKMVLDRLREEDIDPRQRRICVHSRYALHDRDKEQMMEYLSKCLEINLMETGQSVKRNNYVTPKSDEQDVALRLTTLDRQVWDLFDQRVPRHVRLMHASGGRFVSIAIGDGPRTRIDDQNMMEATMLRFCDLNVAPAMSSMTLMGMMGRPETSLNVLVNPFSPLTYGVPLPGFDWSQCRRRRIGGYTGFHNTYLLRPTRSRNGKYTPRKLPEDCDLDWEKVPKSWHTNEWFEW